MKNTHLYVLVAALVLSGLGVFGYKLFVLGFPIGTEDKTQLWEFEARIRFSALGKPTKLTLQIPSRGSKYVIVDESFFSGRYGLSTKYVEGNRQAVWSVRSARGRQTLFYRASIQVAAPRRPGSSADTPPPMPEFAESELEIAKSFLERAREHSADTDTLVSYVLGELSTRTPDADIAMLIDEQAETQDKLNTLSKVLALAGVRSNVVSGVPLTASGQNLKPVSWLEVEDASGVHLYDPATGNRVPDSVPFLILWRGINALGRLDGGHDMDVTLVLKQTEQPALASLVHGPESQRHWIVDYSLFNLPVTTQAVFRILMTIPLGVLVLVLMRNVVGFKTFGTFMPVLIALAFRGTELVAGILFFSLSVSLGLLVRFYLEHLKLILVPRLASVLIVVVLLMAAVTMLCYKLGIAVGLSVSLFPMVVMTMAIERMAIVWDERGAAEALQQGLGSLLVAALAYTVMSIRPLSHLVFVFPELLLLVLGATLLLGRYSGYRLLELRRFKALADRLD
ncbi:MAG: inactive transglutaminase family protein [Gammaproteobacteria bacterium]|nr:inactive transglutaminase family protein [Gammaproteobacteria bacterium]